MRKLPLAVAAVAVLAVAFVAFVARPPALQSTCLRFTLSQTSSNTDSGGSCLVVVSNSSESPVLYAGGFNKTWFRVGYVTNGEWQYTRVWTPGGGPGVMPPHSAINEVVQFPKGATAVKIGLPITALTWRGRFGWYIVGNCPEVLRPVAGLFLAQDERSRSTTEWSSEYAVQSDGRQ